MAFFTVIELVDIIIMTAAIGFIFSSFFKRPQSHEEDHDPLKQSKSSFINWDDFKYAIIITAPAIILHEFGHKFAAMAFRLSATFNAAYSFLVLGIILKLMNFPFIFFVPAYVSFFGATPIQSILIAFAGPAVNLVLWLGSKFVAEQVKAPCEPPPWSARSILCWAIKSRSLSAGEEYYAGNSDAE